MFVYNMNVPLNEAGILEFESYNEEMANVSTFELKEEEYDQLRRKGGLFEQFDYRLNTIIDVCEEERIDYNQIPEAILLTESYMK